MRFVEVISQKKFTLLVFFIALRYLLNFFDGERGFISYYEKQKLRIELIKEKNTY